MSDEQPDIAGLRQGLDEVDSGIVRLIAQRRDLITAIAKVKEHSAEGIQDPDRERRVLDGVVTVATDLGVSASLVRTIFRELISDSVAQQARHLNGDGGGRVRVAFQGTAHSYSDAAAQKYLAGRGLTGDLTGYRTFREAADALLAGDADLAVLPIENTTAGSINEVYALLRSHELFIVGEETWKVDHCLAATAGGPAVLADPDPVASPGARAVLAVSAVHPERDTHHLLRHRGGDAGRGGVGRSHRRRDRAHRRPPPRTGSSCCAGGSPTSMTTSPGSWRCRRRRPPWTCGFPCKTSLILVTGHEEGALLRCLEVLSGSGHSMTKLESRPRPGRPWEYLFFLDFEGNAADPRTAAALDELRSAALYIKVLGSYPAKALRAPARPGRPAWPAARRRRGRPARGRAARRRPAEMLEAVAARPAAPRSRHYKLVDRAARQADTVIRVGDVLVGGDGFVVMAGPCSVESARPDRAPPRRYVRDHGAHVLRGGRVQAADLAVLLPGARLGRAGPAGRGGPREPASRWSPR